MGGEISSGFAIYATRNGPVCVNSIIRLKILKKVGQEALSLTDLCRIFDKPQSSMSVIMNALQEAGLVSVQADESDIRRKIYTLDAREQITFIESSYDQSKVTMDMIRSIVGGEEEFYEGFLVTIMSAFTTMGLNVMPFAENLGMLFGNVISNSVSETNVETVIESVSKFYDSNRIGRITVETMIPLTVKVEHTKKHLNGTTMVLSAFTQGIFKSIFRNRFGRKYVSRSIADADSDGSFSIFVVEPDANAKRSTDSDTAHRCPMFMK